jgi:hypothetical protein
MIGEKFNFEDVFFRDLTVCVLDTLEGQVNWINRFSSGDIPVSVPFYYSLSGDERFLLDSFQDDIVSENRFVELNTDIIPRGHLTLTGFNIKSDEFANPNVWLRMVVENEIEIRKVLAKVRAIPITVNYDLTILLSNEIDTFKCSQAIMDTLWIYKFMYFEYNFMNIDAVILMPDSNQIELSREKNLTSDNNITLKVSFTVETYYPAFRRDRVNIEGYPKYYGGSMTDLNNYTITGGVSEYFAGPGFTGSSSRNPTFTSVTNTTNEASGFPGWPRPPYIGPPFLTPPFSTIGGTETGVTGVPGQDGNTGFFGQTGGFNELSNPFGSNLSQVIGPNGTLTNDPDYFMVSPKRTKWFNNILKARQRSAAQSPNPNSGPPTNANDGASNPPTNPNPL